MMSHGKANEARHGRRAGFSLLCWGLILLGSLQAEVIDWEDTPALNYRTSSFRLWIPDKLENAKGILVLMPGTDGDGRKMAEDIAWQKFAAEIDFGVLGVFMQSNKSGTLPYYRAEAGTAKSLLHAIKALSDQSLHPELENAPLLLWGHSAGGQFNYNFSCLEPSRVIAFIAIKGGYYDMPANASVRAIPALWFIGEKDASFRMENISKLVWDNRKLGALWSFAIEPGAGHELGKTRDLAIPFFKSALNLRLPESNRYPSGSPSLVNVLESSGWLANPINHEITPATAGLVSNALWLPDQNCARRWKNFTTGASPDP